MHVTISTYFFPWSQCDQIGRLIGIWGNFSKPVATISLPKSPTLVGKFCKVVKIFNFSSEIIFGQLLSTFGNFLLVTLLREPLPPSDIFSNFLHSAHIQKFFNAIKLVLEKIYLHFAETMRIVDLKEKNTCGVHLEYIFVSNIALFWFFLRFRHKNKLISIFLFWRNSRFPLKKGL